MNTLEFSRACRTEFAALPEAYRNDDVLEFWFEGGLWYCRPKLSEVTILGNWECYYSDGVWENQEAHL